MKNQMMMAVATLIASTAFTVSAQSVPVESITITPTNAKLAVGGSRTYKVEILPAEAAAGATVEWTRRNLVVLPLPLMARRVVWRRA